MGLSSAARNCFPQSFTVGISFHMFPGLWTFSLTERVGPVVTPIGSQRRETTLIAWMVLGSLSLGTLGIVASSGWWVSCVLSEVEQHRWPLRTGGQQHPSPALSCAKKNISRQCQCPHGPKAWWEQCNRVGSSRRATHGSEWLTASHVLKQFFQLYWAISRHSV